MFNFIVTSIAAFVVFVLVVRAFYINIVTALSSGGSQAKAYTGEQTRPSTSLTASLIATDVRRVVRTSSLLLYYVIYPLLITPGIAIFSVMITSLSNSLNELIDIPEFGGVYVGV